MAKTLQAAFSWTAPVWVNVPKNCQWNMAYRYQLLNRATGKRWFLVEDS